MAKNNNNVNKTALTKFSVVTALMLVGGLAVVVIPAATTTAYADATTCATIFGFFVECETVGKNPESCTNFFGCTPEEESNKETGQRTGELRKDCAQLGFVECSVEGGRPER